MDIEIEERPRFATSFVDDEVIEGVVLDYGRLNIS